MLRQIPRQLADDIAEQGGAMEQFEDFVVQEVLRGRPIIGRYPPTDPGTPERFAMWKAAQS